MTRNYFQQNVRGQIDVFFPDPSKYDLTAPRPKHWALDKPKKVEKPQKPVSQIKVQPQPKIESKSYCMSRFLKYPK